MSSTGMSICSQQLHMSDLELRLVAMNLVDDLDIHIPGGWDHSTSKTVRDNPWHVTTPAAHGVTGQVFARIDLSKRCAFQITLITLIH